MKSKVTKNRKKGWRKVDITDVEDAIEDQRLQERTGYVQQTVQSHSHCDSYYLLTYLLLVV